MMATTKKKSSSKKATASATKKTSKTKSTTKKTAKNTAQSSAKSTTKAKKSVKKTTAKPSSKSTQKKEQTNYAPTKKRANLIAILKEKLEKEREEILHGLQNKVRPDEVTSHGDLVDQSTTYSEHEIMLGLAEHERQRLQEINHALEKIENGTYGICEKTGKLISDERLMAMPTARYSIEYQSQMENRR